MIYLAFYFAPKTWSCCSLYCKITNANEMPKMCYLNSTTVNITCTLLALLTTKYIRRACVLAVVSCHVLVLQRSSHWNHRVSLFKLSQKLSGMDLSQISLNGSDSLNIMATRTEKEKSSCIKEKCLRLCKVYKVYEKNVKTGHAVRFYKVDVDML